MPKRPSSRKPRKLGDRGRSNARKGKPRRRRPGMIYRGPRRQPKRLKTSDSGIWSSREEKKP